MASRANISPAASRNQRLQLSRPTAILRDSEFRLPPIILRHIGHDFQQGSAAGGNQSNCHSFVPRPSRTKPATLTLSPKESCALLSGIVMLTSALTGSGVDVGTSVATVIGCGVTVSKERVAGSGSPSGVGRGRQSSRRECGGRSLRGQGGLVVGWRFLLAGSQKDN